MEFETLLPFIVMAVGILIAIGGVVWSTQIWGYHPISHPRVLAAILFIVAVGAMLNVFAIGSYLLTDNMIHIN